MERQIKLLSEKISKIGSGWGRSEVPDMWRPQRWRRPRRPESGSAAATRGKCGLNIGGGGGRGGSGGGGGDDSGGGSGGSCGGCGSGGGGGGGGDSSFSYK